MKFNRLAFVVAFFLTAVLFAEVAAHADETDQSTRITFSQPVQVPGQVLPAGSYLFKLANDDDLNVVRIFNADGTRLYATLQSISAQRLEPTDDTVLTFAKQPDGNPVVLVKWFYPGNTIGHEFVYPQREEQELAQDRQQTLTAKEAARAAD